MRAGRGPGLPAGGGGRSGRTRGASRAAACPPHPTKGARSLAGAAGFLAACCGQAGGGEQGALSSETTDPAQQSGTPPPAPPCSPAPAHQRHLCHEPMSQTKDTAACETVAAWAQVDAAPLILCEAAAGAGVRGGLPGSRRCKSPAGRCPRPPGGQRDQGGTLTPPPARDRPSPSCRPPFPAGRVGTLAGALPHAPGAPPHRAQARARARPAPGTLARGKVGRHCHRPSLGGSQACP